MAAYESCTTTANQINVCFLKAANPLSDTPPVVASSSYSAWSVSSASAAKASWDSAHPATTSTSSQASSSVPACYQFRSFRNDDRQPKQSKVFLFIFRSNSRHSNRCCRRPSSRRPRHMVSGAKRKERAEQRCAFQWHGLELTGAGRIWTLCAR